MRPARRVEPFAYYEHTVLARSFSKDMGLAGERIGYLALHPSLAGEQTDRGLESCMRALGMVSAPATAQRALLQLDSWNIDVDPYRVLRDHARDGGGAAPGSTSPSRRAASSCGSAAPGRTRSRT